MKKLILTYLLLFLATTLQAQNGFRVYGGANISHMNDDLSLTEYKSYDWGVGGFVGGGYEIYFTEGLSLMPQLSVAYINNGAKLHSSDSKNYSDWRDSWSVQIPVTLNYHLPLSDNLKLRIAAGPYLQEAFVVRKYKADLSTKESYNESFSQNLNFGILGETALEVGNHFSYMIRAQYPLLKENWSRKTLTLSVGVGYSF